MSGKQYFFKENEVREGRFTLPQDDYDYNYQVMESRHCDFVVEEITRGERLTSWNLHYFMEPEDSWHLDLDLYAHVLMCRRVPGHLERLFPLESDPKVEVAIHAGRVPEAYHPVILPSLCKVGKKVSLIWGTKFAPLIIRIAKFMAAELDIELNDAIHRISIQVCLLVPVLVEKHQADEFNIVRMAGYLKKSLWRACTREIQLDEEYKEGNRVVLTLNVDEDLNFEGSALEDGVRLNIDSDSLFKSYIYENIEHPATVIHEQLLALGYDVHYKKIQRLRKECRETLEIPDVEERPIPTFADMVEAGRKKMRPKKVSLDWSQVNWPEDAVGELIYLVRNGIEVVENEKNEKI